MQLRLLAVVFVGLVAVQAGLPCFEVVLLGTTTPQPYKTNAANSQVLTYGNTDNQCRERNVVVDAARGVLMKLSGIGLRAENIYAWALTHVHHDHTASIGDAGVGTTNAPGLASSIPHRVIMPNDSTINFVEEQMHSFDYDTLLRKATITTLKLPSQNLVKTVFEPLATPQTVMTIPVPSGGDITIEAIKVNHGVQSGSNAFKPAGYRINTPAGVVSFGGDQSFDRADFMFWEGMAAGSDVLIGNILYSDRDIPGLPPTFPATHGNATKFGQLSTRLNAPVVMLTHLFPQIGLASFRETTSGPFRMCDRDGDGVDEICPVTAAEFEALVRRGGYNNDVIVGEFDLTGYKAVYLPVTAIYLVDAKHNTDIVEITNGTVVDLSVWASALDTNKFSLRAEPGANSAEIATVEWYVNRVHEHSDPIAPYCIRNNDDSICKKWNDWPETTSVMTIKVHTTYVDTNGVTWNGVPRHVTFTVVPYDD